MKRTRNSLSYKINHWINIRGWEELGMLIFDISAGIALFAVIFIFSHLFH